MIDTNKTSAAREFVNRWQAKTCIEDEHSRSFWIEFCELLGIENPTHVLDFERKVKGREADVFYEDMSILIEQKSRGEDLDKATIRSKKAGAETPYQQAKWYADNMPHSIRPRWLITCNFDEFRIYDLEEADETYTKVLLPELPDKLYLFDFFTDKSASRLVVERELSIQAGEVVGDLYKEFVKQYKNIETDKDEQNSLNVLIVRLVFLLYAEDAGLLQSHLAFNKYMKNFNAGQMRQALIDLFKVLDTPEGDRDPYLNSELLDFPYINGGLFADEDIVIPQFTEDMRVALLLNASAEFDWKKISPTIFGAVFESTLNPETRRSGGMHYTSIENIHKVIDPLFLDDLTAELEKIEGIKVEKTRIQQLRKYQRKLSELNFLDPAAGSHNFLTETYLSLRKLELRAIEDIQGDQTSFVESPILVKISQLYAIEINDFACAVGKTALWIAEEQMMARTQELLPYQEFDFFPLKSVVNSVCANALRIDWNDVLPAEKCDYVMGNPPFLASTGRSKIDAGASYGAMSAEQKEERKSLFGSGGGNLDYVCCWYKKSTQYMQYNPDIKAAFVSTSSISQGQQVEPLWEPLFNEGVHINFAHQVFLWDNEVKDKAYVFVVIIGFSLTNNANKLLFRYKDFKEEEAPSIVKNINAYLQPAPNVFIHKRAKSLCNVTPMLGGGKPSDGGNLLLSHNERDQLLVEYPFAAKWIRPFSMGEEFINGKERYCLWLVDATPRDIQAIPPIAKRVEAVREMRLKSSKAATRKKADTPWLFDEIKQPKGKSYVALPVVSSARRDYIPIGFVQNGMVPGNKLFFISNATLYVFGVLTSKVHNSWMRAVAGRFGPSYSYANTLVYNNFPWPGITAENIDTPVEEAVPEEIRANIERCAQDVLDARALYLDASLADLYDPDKMPPELRAAHKALDRAVEAAYGVDFDADEEKIVSHLFDLYAELSNNRK